MINLKTQTKKILLWSEKYTRTDMLYVAKGGFWILSEKVVFSLVGILSMLAFANFLDKESFGIYQYVITVFSILLLTTLPGMNSAVNISTAKGYEGIYLKALREKIKWGLLGTLFSFSLGMYYFFQGNFLLGSSFIAFSFFIPFFESLKLYGHYLLGKKEFKVFSKNNIKIKTTSVIILVITIFFTDNLYFILISYILPTIIFNFYYSFKYYYKFKLNKKFDSSFISLGKHLSLIGVFSNFVTHADKLLIFHFLGAKETAIYTFIAMPLIKIKDPFAALINVISLPKISTKSIGELKKILPQKILTTTILLLVVVIIYILTAPFLFKHFLPAYQDYVLFSQILMISLLFLPKIFFYLSLTANHKKKELYIISLSISMLKIILFLLLIPRLGIMGIIVSLILSEFLEYILLTYLFYKNK